jgi:hypothetical protein
MELAIVLALFVEGLHDILANLLGVLQGHFSVDLVDWRADRCLTLSLAHFLKLRLWTFWFPFWRVAILQWLYDSGLGEGIFLQHLQTWDIILYRILLRLLREGKGRVPGCILRGDIVFGRDVLVDFLLFCDVDQDVLLRLSVQTHELSGSHD